MARNGRRLRAFRLVAANVLFVMGAAAFVAGAWLASDWELLTSFVVGGVILFALADLMAPPPPTNRDPRRHECERD